LRYDEKRKDQIAYTTPQRNSTRESTFSNTSHPPEHKHHTLQWNNNNNNNINEIMLERKIRYSCISVLFLATMQIISLSRCHSPFLDQTSSLLDHPLGDIYNVTTERSKRFVSSVAKPKFLSEKTLINYTLDRGFESISTPFFIEKRQVYEYLAYHNIPTDKKIIYFVTPTYMRPTQLVDMVRLSQTLQLDKVIYWVVIEDSPTGTVRMRDLLERSGLMFAHLSIETIQKPRVRGARQRNLGLDVIESVGIPGVAYFGDDDNAYDGTGIV
jgi:hypothetical protein